MQKNLKIPEKKRTITTKNYFNKFAGYKSNTQILVVNNNNNAQSKKEIKKINPINIPLKRIKYLRIHLFREVKDSWTQNYKTLLQILKKTKYMERHPVLLDWKTQYGSNIHMTQIDLQSQCNPYQNINGIFFQKQKKIS